MARFTASIDDNLKARLDTYAKDHGYNRSEALEVMIRAFFEQKADVPQPAPTPPPETPSSPPPSPQPGSARLDELEKQMEQLQAQLRVGTPSNVRLELMEMQVKFQSLLIYLEMQHHYINGLHEVVVANSNACVEELTELGRTVEFYVPSLDPPEWTATSTDE